MTRDGSHTELQKHRMWAVPLVGNGEVLLESCINVTKNGKNVDVLVVDDEPGISRMIRLLLMSEGLSVVAVSNAMDALNYLADNPASLIVLDLAMPGMDGREFFRTLRARGDSTPILILSAHGAREASRELQAEGALPKPFLPEDLLAEIGRIGGLPVGGR